MMKPLVVVLFVGVVCDASLFSSHWETFKARYSKSYGDDDRHRRHIFERNAKLVAKHNIDYDLGVTTYRLALNKFADLTNSEFRSIYSGHRMNGEKFRQLSTKYDDSIDLESVPQTVDWRKAGLVTPVKDQKQCGSCWAFAAVASLEGQHAKLVGKLVSLSEQNLVDCSTDEGNAGCNGGDADQAFDYIRLNRGIDTERSYPYEGSDGDCRFTRQNVGSTLKNYTVVYRSERALQVAAANVGPIAVAIDASHRSFQFYSSGVYDETNCSRTNLDHAVTVVGYGSVEGHDYWLVKNSWGTAWGQKGYILMSRNKANQCGIATVATYPIM